MDGWGNKSYYIFTSNEERNLKSAMRLYSLNMYTDGILVRKYIPVIRKSDSMAGLYDYVSNNFFSSEGGANFKTNLNY